MPDQPNLLPTNKVAAATAAAALATLVLFLIQTATGWQAPDGVEAAITTVLTFAGGYLTKETRR